MAGEADQELDILLFRCVLEMLDLFEIKLEFVEFPCVSNALCGNLL